MKKWTSCDIDKLKRFYQTLSTEELCQLFGRKASGILKKASHLGLKKGIRAEWTASMDTYLRQHYATRTSTQIAADLGVTKSAIKNRRYTLGIYLPDAIVQERYKSNLGGIPGNKGKKVTASKYEKCKGTMFKKGISPHNEKHDGAISIRKDKSGHKYKYLRVAKAKWVLLHRKIWEDAHGQIPKSHIIGFADGDSMNCVLENLYTISKADNMRRHSAVTRLPDGYVARTIVGKMGNVEDVQTIIDHLPEAVVLKRSQILFNREINKQNGTAKRKRRKRATKLDSITA